MRPHDGARCRHGGGNCFANRQHHRLVLAALARRVARDRADARVVAALTGNAFWAAVGDDFLVGSSFPHSALRNTDRFTQYAMIATERALRAARLDPPSRRHRRHHRQHDGRLSARRRISQSAFSRKARYVTPKLMALVIPNMASARIAMHWRLHGPQLAISTACASSLDAIGFAAGMIERGEIDVAIAGGSETLLSPLVYESLVRAGALSRNPDATRRPGHSTSIATDS